MGAFSCGLGLALRAPSMPFDPASLFKGTAGAFYDIRPGNVARDLAGTIPAGTGDTVGRLFDRSGNGNDAGQASGAARPVLGVENGCYYLEFDGIDDKLSAGFSLPQPFERISVIRQIGWTAGEPVLGGFASAVSSLIQAPTSPSLQLNSGPATNAAAIGTTVVVTEHFEGGASWISVNGAAPTMGDGGTAASDGITLGARHASSFANVRIYGLLMIGRALSLVERTQVQTWAATKGRVSL